MSDPPKRLIDADKLWIALDEAGLFDNGNPRHIAQQTVEEQPTVDAVVVVRCKECRWARPYERTDGEIGYYCHFCGHAFMYGTNWERLFTPIKESDDFCSYGERKADEGNTQNH